MLVDAVPALLIVAGVAGVVVAIRLRRRQPAVYSAVAASALRRPRGPDPDETPSPVLDK